jgi:hypothetical protein
LKSSSISHCDRGDDDGGGDGGVNALTNCDGGVHYSSHYRTISIGIYGSFHCFHQFGETGWKGSLGSCRSCNLDLVYESTDCILLQ